VVNRDVVVDEKIPFFSNNDNSTDSSVWETVTNSGTSSSVEIKQGSKPEESKESSSREGFSEEEKDSHPSQLNREGQHNRPKWYYNRMYDVQEDEIPKEIEGRSTRSGKQIVQGGEQVNFALTFVVFQVFEPTTFEESKGKPEWEAAIVRNRVVKQNRSVLLKFQ
jgi:hypothetical protein